ncbi:(2Fe-2S)-binding protein [Streptomyces tubercidicus]|uniref:(2Fe-2S)-binding protein n=1 Tax=Streptomyces tubercidicus TaxID=47759 RepID=UPI00135B95CD
MSGFGSSCPVLSSSAGSRPSAGPEPGETHDDHRHTRSDLRHRPLLQGVQRATPRCRGLLAAYRPAQGTGSAGSVRHRHGQTTRHRPATTRRVPHVPHPPLPLATALLAREPLASAGTLTLDPLEYRRHNCCLYYRVSGSGYCDECVLHCRGRAPRGAERVNSATT